MAEVDAYFRSRQWFNVGKGVSAPPTYQFLTEPDGDVVGYAAVAFRNSHRVRIREGGGVTPIVGA